MLPISLRIAPAPRLGAARPGKRRVRLGLFLHPLDLILAEPVILGASSRDGYGHLRQPGRHTSKIKAQHEIAGLTESQRC